MGAVGLLAWAEMRRNRGAMVLFVGLVALVSGAVFTAAAGARRTSGVLDRFLDAQGTADLTVAVSRPRIASDSDVVKDLAARLSTLHGVEDVVAGQTVFPWIDPVGDFSLLTGPDARYLDVARSAMADGRMPTADGIGEVALNETAAEMTDLGVGDVFEVPTLRPETAESMWGNESEFEIDGPVLRFDIVGVYRETETLMVDSFPAGVLSPDTGSNLDEVAASGAYFFLTGDPDDIDIDGALAVLGEAAPDGYPFSYDPRDTIVPIRSTFDAIAVGLALFALVAAVAGVIALALVTARQVGQTAPTASVVRALGMRDRSVALATALPSAAATSVGVLVGAVIAVALSPRFPFSAARRAEVDPGVRVDWPVLIVGSTGFVLVLSGWTLLTAWRQLRPRMARAAGPSILSTVGVGLRRRLPIAAGIGCSTVLAPPSSRAGTKPGSAIFGAVLGVAGVIAIAVFIASHHSTVEHPERYGWPMDSMPYAEEYTVSAAERLAEDERLDGVAVTYCSTVFVQDEARPTFGCAFETLSGSIALTQLSGRAPTSPDEVGVGERTLAEHGLDVGDTIVVTGESGVATPLSIVGTFIAPDPSNPGRAVVLTLPGLTQLHGMGDLDVLPFDPSIALEYPPDVDVAALEAALWTEYELSYSFEDAYPMVPQSLSQMRRVRSTLFALAAFLGLVGVVGLVHFMLMSVGQGRHDTAVLKALGFVKRQTRAVVASQAVTIAAIGVVVGLPLGVVIGRSVWIAAIDEIGIVETPTVPWLVAALVAGAVFVGALAASAFPAWSAARRTPTDTLRTG